MSSLTTSIIVCAYTEQRWDDLVAALAGLDQQTVPITQRILVIDHNPLLLERARATFPTVSVIANREQRGLSGARNTGIAHATGDIVLFMDEDAVPEKDWLRKLLTHYESDSVMGVGGAILPNWVAGRPGWFPSEFDWVIGCTYTGMPQEIADVRNLIGCNMSFRQLVFERVGLFTDGIGRVGTRPVGCEETELCIRTRQKMPGIRMVYDPSAVVHHRVPESRGRFRYFVDRCYSEGLSKALIARHIGRSDGLSSESAYTIRTLPLGVLGGARDALRGDAAGLLRAGAIVIGFSCTALGYLWGSMQLALKGHERTAAHEQVV